MSYQDSSHDSAYPFLAPGDARNRDLTYINSPGGARRAMRVAPSSGPRARRIAASPAQFGRAEVATAVGSPCSGAVSDRLRRVRAAEARRAWIERQGEADTATPVWLSRDGWLDDVRVWAASPEFAAACASVRVSITSATVVAVAVLWAGFADHGTGRNAAVTRARIAHTVGCAAKTVSRAWQVLGAAGWAVEAARGHGSSSGHTAGNRPSIWHLVSRRPTVPAAADSGGNVHLPPQAGSCLLALVERYSPSVRGRAREHVSPSEQPRLQRARRRWRATPRPLAVQRLADELVGNAYGRRPLCHGLCRGHIGAVCDALTSAGIDPAIWTARDVRAALDADMRATGWSWPDQIERPGAFLAARLRRLPARPDTTSPVDGGTAAGLDQDRTAPVEPSASPVEFTAPQRARIAAAKAYAHQTIADARQRRADRETAAPRRRVSPMPTAAATPATAAACSCCGAPGAPPRGYMPARRAHVCDDCWGAS